MDATPSLTAPTPNPSLASSLAPADPVRVVHTAARHALRRRAARSAPDTLPPAPTAGPAQPRIQKPPTLLQHWNRRGWPILEFIAAAALIIGLVTAITGGLPGGNGTNQHSLIPGQSSQDAATPSSLDSAVAMEGGNAGRTGVVPGTGPESDPSVAWSRYSTGDSASGSYSASLTVGGGYLYTYVMGQQQPITLVAIDAMSGATRWQTSLANEDPIPAAPTLAKGLLFVPVTRYVSIPEADRGTPTVGSPAFTTVGGLIAFDAATGEQRWAADNAGVGFLSPLVVGDQVVVFNAAGTINAFDLATGKARWHASIPVKGTVGPKSSLSSGDGLIFAATNTGDVYALDVSTGDERWHTAIGGNDPSTVAFADGNAYVIANDLPTPWVGPGPAQAPAATPSTSADGDLNPGEGRLYAIGADDGNVKWQVDLDRATELAPVITPDAIILSAVGTNSNQIQARDLATGTQVLWTRTLDGDVPASAVVSDGVAYVGSQGGEFYAIDVASAGDRWVVTPGGSVMGSPVVAGGLVYFTSSGANNALLAIKTLASAPPAISGTPVDVSGLPPCTVTPRPERAATPFVEGSVPTFVPPEGTPEYTLPGTDESAASYSAPAIAWNAIPVGSAPTQDQISGIQATIEGIQACSRPGYGRYVAAYFSDDYFLRAWVAESVDVSGYQYLGGTFRDADSQSAAANTRVLPDGRIALILPSPNPQYGGLVIFAQHGESWLVDEVVAVSVDGQQHGG